MAKTAEEYRQMAADCRKRSQESWERSDTDGFLSQWASDTSARLYDRLAEIVENGGMADFPALIDSEGKEVPAKLIHGKWGMCWALTDASGKFTGKFVGDNDKAIKKAGYTRGEVPKRAWACLKSNGTGLSGNVWVCTFPIDNNQNWKNGNGYQRPVKVRCEKCGWVDEESVEFLNIEEDIQGKDVLTFKCKCGLRGQSHRVG